jgi:diguanylate cyclase (GGDEF)-like protein
MKTILVIEDDPAIRNNIAMILRSQGFVILQAEDGLTGIELALGADPDLIVCDIMLPEISGYEILEQLRQVPESAVTPFIFLTALADRADMRQGMNLGADDYLTKPFTSQELIGAVNARLQKQQELTEPYRNEMRKVTEKLNQMVYTDLLTNLPNRILFWKKIDEHLSQSPPQVYALILVQLANFDQIVETSGQSTADLLLQYLARSLQSLVQEQDVLARCQPNCFGILISQNPDNYQSLEQWLNPLIQEWVPRYRLGQQLIDCHLRIAIAPYPLAGKTTPDLVRSAEQVLNLIEADAPVPYGFYTDELHQNIYQSERIEKALRFSLDRGEFSLQYQPILNTITGRIVAIEVSLQWNNPDFRDIDPLELHRSIQQSEQILSIELWMIRTAIQELQTLQRHYLNPLKLAINISKSSFEKPDFLHILQSILQESHTDPSLLIIEVQESDLLNGEPQILNNFEILRNQGIQITLDDFGTSDSSVTHLSRLPLNYLKINAQITQALSQDPQSESILKTMINLAQSLRLKVIADGVETQEQLSFLRKQGCLMVQGNLYSASVPVGDVINLLSLPTFR